MSPITQPLQVSSNQRFLTTADGQPFFWLGDTAWELFHRLTREDADFYLSRRQQQGFNAVQAVALSEFNGLRTPNAYGHLPLLNEDPAQPNPAYFEHVDYIVNSAGAHGLYVGLLPTWGDKVNLAWGIGPVVFTPERAHRYGQWLGARYRQPNVVWVLGGDRPVATPHHLAIWRALAAGLRAGGSTALMTYHPTPNPSSSAWFHTDEWLAFNMIQSSHMRHDRAVWDMIAADYARTPPKPTLDAEPNYEDHPVNWDPANGYFRGHDVRKQCYRSVLAGGCGVTYGHYSVFPFFSPADGALDRPATAALPFGWHQYYWRDALERPGAQQMVHLRRLLESRPYFDRVPAADLLRHNVEGGDFHLTASRAVDGSYAMVYAPYSGQIIHMDLYPLAGRLQAWWYDPRTGQAQAGESFANPGHRDFKSPPGGPDWVLVLDDVVRQFPPPGQPIATDGR